MPSDDDDAPLVPIVCEACETTSRIPLSDVPDTIQKHNDQLHDGEDIAQVDPEIVRHVTDLAAEDIGVSDDDA
ncbi:MULTISPECIES: hypothetical protein [Haloferax]|uniref:DUF8149 domain-containing protein n=2 Tax=Haloferax TaxID=2251 RepID=A0A6A8GK85_9EURY|nr:MULTISPECIES: hypothetical protein [Haloferax]KAB1194624.1 hypothetical protein Hfx1148_14635 [Haloferax sp. CBA1148]KTG13089.1 hypothetical protein AUR66_03525 [Haloferax profundi]MRX23201.1 hypothetical protein [Haloferax litoreum]